MILAETLMAMAGSVDKAEDDMTDELNEWLSTCQADCPSLSLVKVFEPLRWVYHDGRHAVSITIIYDTGTSP